MRLSLISFEMIELKFVLLMLLLASKMMSIVDVDVDDDVDLIATIMPPTVTGAPLMYHTKDYTY